MTSTSIVKRDDSPDPSVREISGPTMPTLTLQQYLEGRLRTVGQHRIVDSMEIHDGSVIGDIQLVMTMIGNLAGNRSEDFAIDGSELTHDRVEGLINAYYQERGWQLVSGDVINRNADLAAIGPGVVQLINVSCCGIRALVTVFNPEPMA